LATIGHATLVAWEDRGSAGVGETRLVEGRDFADQQELRAARGAQPGRFLTREERALGGILATVMRDLELFQWCRQLPRGADYGTQTWWRVCLWLAYWRAVEQGRAAGGAE